MLFLCFNYLIYFNFEILLAISVMEIQNILNNNGFLYDILARGGIFYIIKYIIRCSLFPLLVNIFYFVFIRQKVNVIVRFSRAKVF